MTTAVAGGVTASSYDNVFAGGAGDDSLTGSGNADFFFLDAGGVDYAQGFAGDDAFYFGAALGENDYVFGDAGNDMVILQGRYTQQGVNGIGSARLSGIETLVLMSAADTRFGASGTGNNAYILDPADANMAAGEWMTIQGNKLGALETLTFYGFGETDGHFRIVGGAANDSIIGGWQDDIITGGLGQDVMSGFLGNDVFVYRSSAESLVAAPDTINDLDVGDRVDLHMIDADTGTGGDEAFAFIGSDTFHNLAGELRAFESGGHWMVQADTNGDGAADFALQMNLQSGQPPLDASFFIL